MKQKRELRNPAIVPDAPHQLSFEEMRSIIAISQNEKELRDLRFIKEALEESITASLENLPEIITGEMRSKLMERCKKLKERALEMRHSIAQMSQEHVALMKKNSQNSHRYAKGAQEKWPKEWSN